jgi:hypothetical protein
MLSGCGRYRVRGVVEVERLLREARCARPHVRAHLAHLLRVADPPSSAFDASEIIRGRGNNDLLHYEQVVAHVLALVVRHHREEGYGDACVHSIECLLRFAHGGGLGRGRDGWGDRGRGDRTWWIGSLACGERDHRRDACKERNEDVTAHLGFSNPRIMIMATTRQVLAGAARSEPAP